MATREDRDQKWRDDRLMSLGGSYESPVPGLRFIVPKACAPDAKGGNDDQTPGIYLLGRMRVSGPNIEPKHGGRLLTQREALEYARNFDGFARPMPDQQPNDTFHHGKPEGYYPATYEALVEAFYECLGRRLDSAITEAEDRRSELRETRAAIVGATHA